MTVEQATELLKRPNALRLGVTELSAEAAVVLAKFPGELRFEALTTLSPEAATALAGREGPLELPKLAVLPPSVAKALSGLKGGLVLPGVKELSAAAAEALAAHVGPLNLGVTELPEEAAAALAKHPGDIRLKSLKSLTSLKLAERLGQQEWVYIDGVSRLSPDIAKALCPPGNLEKFKGHVQFYVGLTELPPDVAAAIIAGLRRSVPCPRR